ncbi:MAG TPA: aminotransferase class I/II-fold pyridoxal phosphate-dependent enzyme [Chitinophagales bacterium]|nr:aminotransferase class I/II-fold pyridoxal phosphate-dependent enzyme [Chitinophagales bacterium]HRG27620.1 aminotransferase class I/II-fold pyridoxal phosphate-dependent enzyme [Chitinophagales bacterium]HRG85876.1 aminotransferase class I/II-fold pyridoxal phosphate-dependent enzyme [Chitinophagales bacterium]HRH51929.1 aminotransferase class I/II-fold pyridoxal phosphate-dependent enzyme [Chitinophagales bacterium]
MENERIYLSPPHMGGTELAYIQHAFDTNWIAPLGPHVDAFENDLSGYLHVKACAALSSGTAALHLALIQLNVQQNDYVICPTFTFSASANPILYQKAIPVFVDSEKDTWNMDPELLEEAVQFCLRQNKKPKAIIVVHLYGMPAKLKAIQKIADDHGIPIIEDAAESLGSTYYGKHTGSFGTFGILSFNGNKIITTSGGGALVSSNIEAIKKTRFLATQARDPAPHYQHSSIGYNYRMSNICAAIGRGQMEVLSNRIDARKKNFNYYHSRLSVLPAITFLPEPENVSSNRWLTTIQIDSTQTSATPNSIRLALEELNIESRPLWKPLHLQPVFAQFPSFVADTSANLFQNGLCLPSGSALTEIQLDRICSCVEAAIKA